MSIGHIESPKTSFLIIMSTPYFGKPSRRPHFWKIRNDGFRKLCQDHGWGMRGGYACKSIGGREFMQIVVSRVDDYVICRFQAKDDYWSVIAIDARDREAKEARSRLKVIAGSKET